MPSRPKSQDAPPNNLPRQLTSFIGREKEIAEVKRLLSTACLVTLTGTGGAGKTRLALQVGADLLNEYSDGVCRSSHLSSSAAAARSLVTVSSRIGSAGRHYRFMDRAS